MHSHHPHILLLTAWCLTTPATSLACPVDDATLATRVDAALDAFPDGAFYTALAEARQGAACLSVPITSVTAARLHLLEALAAWQANDMATTAGALQAATSADPALRLPTATPPGLRPLADFLPAEPVADPGLALTTSAGLATWVDGTPASHRPLLRPAYLQWIDEAGVARTSHWLATGQPLPPAAPTAESPSLADMTSVDIPTDRDAGRIIPVTARPWVWSAGGTTLAAGLVYLGAALVHGQWESELEACLAEPCADWSQDRKDGIENRRVAANGLVVGSAALGVTALGLGAVAVLRW